MVTMVAFKDSHRSSHLLFRVEISFNERVLEKENEVVPINSALPEFLMGMSMNKSTFVSINVGQWMRGTQPIGGQLWIQEDRKMSATSTVLPDTGHLMEVVALDAVSDALTWRHVFEVYIDVARMRDLLTSHFVRSFVPARNFRNASPP
jgi:hypothetical protein